MIYRPAAMKLLPLATVLLTATLFWVGCGDSGRPPGMARNDSPLVGGACMNDSECEGFCQTGTRFPGGTCSISCGNSGNCPQGSSCAQLDAGWICLVDCTSTPDCRTDYACEPVPEAGTGGASTVMVCIGPEPAS